MEVFSKYFRRLLTGNSPQIFPGINKVVENAGNYPLLVQELQKVSQDLDQAQKIADTIDTSEGDIFRDFDLSTFLDHFKLDPLIKVSLALAFKPANKSDLRAKGEFLPVKPVVPLTLVSLLTLVSGRNPDQHRSPVPPEHCQPHRDQQGLHTYVPGPYDRTFHPVPPSQFQ
jgi:CCR4-NOT transcription complex subunit 1